ncbi:MAG: hypothetical protein IKL37_00055 [Alphaproteobacteria bacterium]|nr:hypothetical protein [Alphaproteobacteria bacterium]
MDVISESGIITDKGQLRLPMDRLNAFFAANKGKRVVVRFEADTPGSTALQQAYYYNYVVPTIKAALYEKGERFTESGVDRWIINNYPLSKDLFTEDGNPKVVGKQLTISEMFDLLEWLKQFAAENLYVYIEDPRTL